MVGIAAILSSEGFAALRSLLRLSCAGPSVQIRFSFNPIIPSTPSPVNLSGPEAVGRKPSAVGR